MSAAFLAFFAMALGAALCSPLGGGLAILLKPSSLLLSVMAGCAGGVLMGAIAFEMLPEALEQASLIEVVIGFVAGVALVYGFDLYMNRGAIAGLEAEQRPLVERLHLRRRPRAGKVTILAGASSAEELIEGLVLGVSAELMGGVGYVVAIAVAIDNVSEAMSLGAMIRADKGGDPAAQRRQTLRWTGLIGAALLVSALAGWFALRAVPDEWLGLLSSTGAGAVFYLAFTQLLPEAESHHYQHSGGLAAAAGFLVIMVLSRFT